MGLWYGKSDSSLPDDTGVELVSHPFSERAWRESNRPTENLADVESRLDPDDSCGLHVHVTRPSRLTCHKLQRFAYENEGYCYDVAGRAGNGFAQIYKPSPKDAIHRGGRRYSAVNLCPLRTVEFRLFNAVSSAEAVREKVLWCFDLIAFCETHSLRDLDSDLFFEWRKARQKVAKPRPQTA
jgi:hypothetical protein